MKLKTCKPVNKALLILISGLCLNNGFVKAAHAEDANANPEGYYSPAGCTFEATFPSEPYTKQKCVDRPGFQPDKECFDITSYTQVYDMVATFDVNLSCSPIPENTFDTYTERMMTIVLNGMAGDQNLTDQELNFKDYGDIRSGMLSGVGTSAQKEQIYIAQIWVDEASVLSLEARLIGESHPEGDKEFADFLRSIQHKKENEQSNGQATDTSEDVSKQSEQDKDLE